MSEAAVKFLLNSLFLILGLLAVYFLLVKLNLGYRRSGKREIEILDRCPIDRESSLILFRVKGVTLLCCQSRGEVKVLREWKDEDKSEISSSSFPSS